MIWILIADLMQKYYVDFSFIACNLVLNEQFYVVFLCGMQAMSNNTKKTPS